MVLLNRKYNLLMRFSSLVLIVALMGFILFSVFYLHMHIDPNGHLVVHSHPFNKSNNRQNNHTHTPFEFLHHSIFSVLAEFIIFLILLLIFLPLKKISNIVYHFILPESIVLSFYSNRAPPLLSL